MNSLVSFINKNDLLKIELMNYVLETDQKFYETKTLEQEFAVSNYMLREILDSLNIDLHNILDSDWLLLQKGLVYPRYRVTRYHLYKMSQYYFNLSALKPLLETRVLTGSLPTYTTIQYDYGCSPSYFFSQKKILNGLVNDNDSYEFIQAGYVIYNYFDEKPIFSDRIKVIGQEMLKFLLENHFINDLNQRQKMLLINFCVSEMLYNNQALFENREVAIHTVVSLPIIITSFIGNDSDKILSVLLEMLDIFDFLLENKNYKYSQYVSDKIVLLQNDIMPVLENFFSQSTKNEIAQLSYKISVYSLRFGFKNQWFVTNEGEVNLNYFRDIYPSIFKLITYLIDIINIQETIVNNYQRELFCFNLIGIMFRNITNTSIDRVNISVNFSATPITNDMMITMLKNHINHASVDFTCTDKIADIYLSDMIDDDVLGEQVIWKKPPTLSDWTALGELIVKIKKMKSVK